jgi:hypothetical protein
MSRIVIITALTLVAAGCNVAPAASATAPLDGLYTAPRSDGLWVLRIDVPGRQLRLSPPRGGDVTLRITELGPSALRLAPDTACELRAGRRAGSHFTWRLNGASLSLRAVQAPCRSDAAVLTSSPWRDAFPPPPFRDRL